MASFLESWLKVVKPIDLNGAFAAFQNLRDGPVGMARPCLVTNLRQLLFESCSRGLVWGPRRSNPSPCSCYCAFAASKLLSDYLVCLVPVRDAAEVDAVK